MAPVVLQTDVHCFGCARKIRNTVKNLPGVERVQAYPDTGLVVVDGTADAAVLRTRIEHRMRRAVTVVGDGTEGRQRHHHYATTHLAQPQYAPRPAGYPRYYSRGTTTPHPHHYAPQQAGDPYGGGNHYWASQPRRYVPSGTPTRLDDEIHDDYCCSIQ